MITEQPAIKPRTPPVSFAQKIPRRWLGGARGPTQIANGANLLFPAGERFFIRSVRQFADRIEDPELRSRVRGFFGQEGWHANAHERFFDVMREQGYAIDRFLELYSWLAYDVIAPRTSPEVQLSVTVALEHYTAIMAENALEHALFDHAHPALRGLLLWHASEEIEHKSVAFDVLKIVNPSYPLRMVGLALATAMLGGFWLAATTMLVLQDRRLPPDDDAPPAVPLEEHSVVRHVFVRGIREYLRRDFHPSQTDNYHLAAGYLARAGLA